jgi:hypothetical protein
MAEIFSTINPLSNLTGLAKPDGSFKLYSEQLSSINFDGVATKKQTKTKVSDLKPGQTVMVSDASYSSTLAFITKVEVRDGFIDDDPEQPVKKYYIYHVSEFSMEQPFTYNATYGDAYSANAELYVVRDDVENFVIGNDGWALTNNGNAIFSNVFARGRIEATSGRIDGTLDVGTNQIGQPLVQIGTDLFNGQAFESVSQKHSGILLDVNNYLLSYPAVVPLEVSSVVVTDSSVAGYLYSATLTLPLESGEVNTLQVGDFVKLTGFTDPRTIALNNTHQVKSVGTNTFTIAVSYDIGIASPITINVSATSFALNRTYNISTMSVSSVSDNIDVSTVKIYLDDSDFFAVGSEIALESFLGVLSPLNARFRIEDQGEGYVSVSTERIAAGTYTSSLGEIIIYSKVHKFKVGDNFNYLSFSSETGSLKLTGTINAHSGNFINQVYVGQAATTFYIFRKKLDTNVATLRTTEPHSFATGDIITVVGVDSTFDGTYTVKGTPSQTSFTYDKVAANVTEVDLVDFGYASSDSSVDGTIKVGVADTGISIEGTGDPTTSAIYAGEGNFKNPDTGFWMDASGRFSISDQLYFEDGNLTVGGTVTARAFAIDANNYWNTTGNEGDFRVGSANSYLFWNQTDSPNAGDGSLEVKGTINATAGIFSGNIQTTGKIYSGTLDSGGLLTSGIEVASTGIKGIIGGIAHFVLPADGVTKPTITNFEVLNAQITGDKENAFLIAGDVGVTANNVVVRGFRGGTDQTAAIYNTKNGTATTYAGGTGFYFNDDGYFKVGTDTSNAKFDPTANSGSGLFTVTGTINASAGTFTNTVYVGNNATASNNIQLIGTSTAATTAIGIGTGTLGYNTPETKFWADASGRFSLGNKLLWDGTSLLISGGTSSTSTFFNATPNATVTAVGNVFSEFNTINAGSGVNFITSGFKVGMFITGTGIPSSTYIVSLTSTVLTISRYATGDGTGATITGYNPSFASGGSTIDTANFKVDTFGNISASAGRLGFFTLASDGIYGTNIQITNTGMRFFDPGSLFGVMPGTAGRIEAELSSNGINITTGGIFSARGSLNPGGISITSPNGVLFSAKSAYSLDGFDSTEYFDGTANIMSGILTVTNSFTAGQTGASISGRLLVSESATANTMYTSNWFRSTGNSGWYSQTYGGGWYMIDTTWIRAYSDKNVYTAGVMRADGGFQGNATSATSASNAGTYGVISAAGGVTGRNFTITHNKGSGAIITATGRNDTFDIVCTIRSITSTQATIQAFSRSGSTISGTIYMHWHAQ